MSTKQAISEFERVQAAPQTTAYEIHYHGPSRTHRRLAPVGILVGILSGPYLGFVDVDHSTMMGIGLLYWGVVSTARIVSDQVHPTRKPVGSCSMTCRVFLYVRFTIPCHQAPGFPFFFQVRRIFLVAGSVMGGTMVSLCVCQRQPILKWRPYET